MAKKTTTTPKANYVVQPDKLDIVIWGPKGKYPPLGDCKPAELAEIHEKNLTKYITKLG